MEKTHKLKLKRNPCYGTEVPKSMTHLRMEEYIQHFYVNDFGLSKGVRTNVHGCLILHYKQNYFT